MRKLSKTERERGQSTVEAAIVLPVFLILVFTLAEFGWLVYCDASLSSAISHMEYHIDAEDLASYGSDMDALVKDKILEADPILKSGDLDVSAASVKIDGDSNTKLLSDTYLKTYGLQTANEKTTKVKVSANVDYRPMHLFGAFFDAHFKRVVESSSLASSTFELG